jgi:hypothetical protein
MKNKKRRTKSIIYPTDQERLEKAVPFSSQEVESTQTKKREIKLKDIQTILTFSQLLRLSHLNLRIFTRERTFLLSLLFFALFLYSILKNLRINLIHKFNQK